MANSHSVVWVRILGAGEAVRGHERIKRTMLVQDSMLAPLYTLRKDHEKCDCPIPGPLLDPFVVLSRRTTQGCHI